MVEVFSLGSVSAPTLARTMALRPSETGVQGDVLSGACWGVLPLLEWSTTCPDRLPGVDGWVDRLAHPSLSLEPSPYPALNHTKTALILAFTALQDTARKKTDRRIVILTDGRSKIRTADGLQEVVDGVSELSMMRRGRQSQAFLGKSEAERGH